MNLTSFSAKTKSSLHIIKNEGMLNFLVKLLHFLKKKQSRTVERHRRPISLIVKYDDLIATDLSKPPQPWTGTTRKSLRLNWIMPPPGKGSGGHINIFRFIKFAEEAGHTCRIYLYADGGSAPMSSILEQMGDSYPEVKAVTTMQWLNDVEDMDESDAIFSTSWETAYASFIAPKYAKRFYFVQDFEPYFFSTGSLFTLAENTYKFNFYGITAGKWLANKLHTEYGMSTDYYDFGADKTTYFLTNKNKRNEVFFYARPYTGRRAFELGIVTLDLFHKKHPKYTINLVGWDVSDYAIPFPYVNLKTLAVSELNDLYNRCAAGLVLSLTNMSLLPLEMLASGTIPVVNDGENNRLVSDNTYIAYAMNNPVSLSNALSEVVEKKHLAKYAAEASASVPSDSWKLSGEKFISVIEKEVYKK